MERAGQRTTDAATRALVATARHDRVAFAALVDDFRGPLLAYVRRFVVDRSQTEEVVQDVFLDVWEHAGRFDPARAEASAWLYTLAHHKAVDRVRSAESSRRRDLDIGRRDFEPDDGGAGAERIEHLERRARLSVALGTLTAVQRDAVCLRYLAELTNDEMADRLGVTRSTAKTRMRDGLVRLRELLGAPGTV